MGGIWLNIVVIKKSLKIPKG